MKVGLALSGGGIRGIAHAGALKALEDNNIKIYNATRGGKLEVFERKSLDELFEEVENNEV